MRALITLAAAAAVAAPGAAPVGVPAGQPAPTPASEVVCSVDDPRAVELSGLVATAEGYVSIVDSQWDRSQMVIVYLDRQCRVVRTQAYPTAPRDPEDLAVAPDGALWVGDIGDNATSSTRRSTIALWRIPPGGGDPVIHRLTYPDGPHDAEALLFTGDGTPLIITKELSDTALIYRPVRALEPGTAEGVPLERAGELRIEPIGALDDLGRLGGLLVTGAASAPGRDRVVIRTYTAAYEFDVRAGDVLGAIVAGQPPRVTPLPDDVQGEAISYTTDGRGFLTVSDEPGPTVLRRYEPTAAQPPGMLMRYDRTGIPATWWLLLGIGVAGALILVAAGVALAMGRARAGRVRG